MATQNDGSTSEGGVRRNVTPVEGIALACQAYGIYRDVYNGASGELVSPYSLLHEGCSPTEREHIVRIIDTNPLNISEEDSRLIDDLVFRAEIVSRPDVRKWAETWRLGLWEIASMPIEMVNFLMLVTLHAERYVVASERGKGALHDMQGHLAAIMHRALQLNALAPESIRSTLPFSETDTTHYPPVLLHDLQARVNEKIYPITRNFDIALQRLFLGSIFRNLFNGEELAAALKTPTGEIVASPNQRIDGAFLALQARIYTMIHAYEQALADQIKAGREVSTREEGLAVVTYRAILSRMNRMINLLVESGNAAVENRDRGSSHTR